MVATTSPKSASTPASRASVLASWPKALPKRRTCRALTTTAGNEAASKAPTAFFWYGPVDSNTIRSGAISQTQATSWSMPAASLAKRRGV